MTRPFEPIPGETPIEDLSGLRLKGVRTRPQLNEREAENTRKATVKYLAASPSTRAAPFDLAWIKRLHAEMFGDVWEWAGAVRTVELNLGAPAHEIETRLHSLLGDIQEWKRSGMPLVEQAARLHHRAVSTHPFLNGNGRWARTLANIWLKQNGEQPVEWPEATIGDASDIRAAYLAALRAADAGDLAPLTELHCRYAGASDAEPPLGASPPAQ